MVDKIKNGVVVTMTYRMTVDGNEIEEAPEDDPLYYLHGSDNIVPGLEAALTGKSVGDKMTVTLAPEDAYGEYDNEDVLEADLSDLEIDGEIVIGDIIELEDASGLVREGTVTAVTEDTVTFDLNDEMAGKTVTFEVEVLSLREATEDEIEEGEPEEYADLFYDDEEEDEHDHEH